MAMAAMPWQSGSLTPTLLIVMDITRRPPTTGKAGLHTTHSTLASNQLLLLLHSPTPVLIYQVTGYRIGPLGQPTKSQHWAHGLSPKDTSPRPTTYYAVCLAGFSYSTGAAQGRRLGSLGAPPQLHHSCCCCCCQQHGCPRTALRQGPALPAHAAPPPAAIGWQSRQPHTPQWPPPHTPTAKPQRAPSAFQGPHQSRQVLSVQLLQVLRLRQPAVQHCCQPVSRRTHLQLVQRVQQHRQVPRPGSRPSARAWP